MPLKKFSKVKVERRIGIWIEWKKTYILSPSGLKLPLYGGDRNPILEGAESENLVIWPLLPAEFWLDSSKPGSIRSYD